MPTTKLFIKGDLILEGGPVIRFSQGYKIPEILQIDCLELHHFWQPPQKYKAQNSPKFNFQSDQIKFHQFNHCKLNIQESIVIPSSWTTQKKKYKKEKEEGLCYLLDI